MTDGLHTPMAFVCKPWFEIRSSGFENERITEMPRKNAAEKAACHRTWSKQMQMLRNQLGGVMSCSPHRTLLVTCAMQHVQQMSPPRM